jgi:hypothetical protein
MVCGGGAGHLPLSFHARRTALSSSGGAHGRNASVHVNKYPRRATNTNTATMCAMKDLGDLMLVCQCTLPLMYNSKNRDLSRLTCRYPGPCGSEWGILGHDRPFPPFLAFDNSCHVQLLRRTSLCVAPDGL